MKLDSTELNRLKDELRHLVLISSQSHDVKGVNRVQRYIANELKKLGFKINLYAAPSTQTGNLLVANFKQPAKKNLKYVTLVCHADTVLGLDKFAGFKISRNGEHAIGSGVIDDKGGIIVLVEGLRKFLKEYKNRSFPFNLRVICSPSEEIGSIGLQKKFRTLSNNSKVVLGFEPALDDGSIIHARRGNRWYQVNVTGKSAHAGRSKGEHINAAHDIAIKISKLVKLNNSKKEMSLNVSEILGGSEKFNITCGTAECKIDVRYGSFEASELMHKKIMKILSQNERSSLNPKLKAITKYSIADDCPPFASNEESRKAVKNLIQIISKIEGQKVYAKKAGGAGDVNYMSRKNLIVIDGLGPVGGALHTSDEFVKLSSLSTRSQSLSQFLKYFCGQF